MGREKAIHKKFESLRVKREWFRADENLLTFVKEIKGVDVYLLDDFVKNYKVEDLP